MKITFTEFEHGVSFDMTPETVEEVGQIARMAANTSAEKPTVTFYFGNNPSGSVWIKKVSKGVQVNMIDKRLH